MDDPQKREEFRPGRGHPEFQEYPVNERADAQMQKNIRSTIGEGFALPPLGVKPESDHLQGTIVELGTRRRVKYIFAEGEPGVRALA
jgi:hypothetical protein